MDHMDLFHPILMNRNSHFALNHLVYLKNFPMRILVIVIFYICLKTEEVQAGRFFDEMEKFKDGLALRPRVSAEG